MTSLRVNTLITEYDVTKDGKRFIVEIAPSVNATSAPITVVQNWEAALMK
jgi:hypothetical protein